MVKRTLVAVVMALGVIAWSVEAAELKFSAGSSKIEFTGSKKDGKHDGGFQQFAGTIDLPGDDFAQATVKVEIQTASLTSDNPKLTQHLKTPDFFDVRTHPKATFVSTAIKPAAGGTYEVTGNLTLHGVTKPVTVPVKVTKDAGGLKLDGTFTLQRQEFGMTYGQGMVNNDVTVRLSIRATR